MRKEVTNILSSYQTEFSIKLSRLSNCLKVTFYDQLLDNFKLYKVNHYSGIVLDMLERGLQGKEILVVDSVLVRETIKVFIDYLNQSQLVILF